MSFIVEHATADGAARHVLQLLVETRDEAEALDAALSKSRVLRYFTERAAEATTLAAAEAAIETEPTPEPA